MIMIMMTIKNDGGDNDNENGILVASRLKLWN